VNKDWLRLSELVALVLVAAGLIGLAAYMVHKARVGEAFGAVITTIPLVVQAIRNIGSAQAMNAMAEYLAKSSPVKNNDEGGPL
jgi:type II secretory pathway component PulF